MKSGKKQHDATWTPAPTSATPPVPGEAVSIPEPGSELGPSTSHATVPDAEIEPPNPGEAMNGQVNQSDQVDDPPSVRNVTAAKGDQVDDPSVRNVTSEDKVDDPPSVGNVTAVEGDTS